MSETFSYLMRGDCLTLMREIPDNYVDMIMCDLPYGTTACKWDSIIPFDNLWLQYKRICKGAIVLTAAQPFTSALVMSNVKNMKHHWIWKKERGTGFQVAKFRPMMQTEDICCFSSNGDTLLYNPIKIRLDKPRKEKFAGTRSDSSPIANMIDGERIAIDRFPTNIIEICRDKNKIHPTQKPVALMEYLIKTYTNPGMIVLDNCMGSGTTGVACKNLGRSFIGIEKDDNYFAIAKQRIEETPLPLQPTADGWVGAK